MRERGKYRERANIWREERDDRGAIERRGRSDEENGEREREEIEREG